MWISQSTGVWGKKKTEQVEWIIFMFQIEILFLGDLKTRKRDNDVRDTNRRLQ